MTLREIYDTIEKMRYEALQRWDDPNDEEQAREYEALCYCSAMLDKKVRKK